MTEVATALAPTAADVYRLDVLDDASALALLQRLAPGVTDEAALQELVTALEGLPLALQVAGHLLRDEDELGLGVDALLANLRAGTGLLTADAPADRRTPADETTPTVATLLRQSTDRLPPEDRERFALLGAFAPKPATFAVDALMSVWEVEDPVPTIRRLVRLGLLEPMGDRRFEMHAVLVLHAQTLLDPA